MCARRTARDDAVSRAGSGPDETAGAAMLDAATGELASAKSGVETAVAALRQWVTNAEAGK